MAPESRIGQKLTTLRKSLNLSVDELAERCGCSTEVISGLEAGHLAPSLAPLIKITRALGVRLGTLLDDDTSIGPVITRAGDAESAARLRSLETASDAGTLGFFSLAATKASRHMEPFLIEVRPGEEGQHALSSHEGEEFIYVLSGSVEIEYGKELYALGPGDSIYYDSIVPHQVRAYHGVPAHLLAVVYAPA
jgi:transcriptional regulator with XRE-family HTH domain